MFRKFLVLLFMGLCFFAALSEAQPPRPNLYFNLVDLSYATFNSKKEVEPDGILTTPHAVGHFGKFMVFFGPLGVGTAIVEYNDFDQLENSSILKGDTIFAWSISREKFISYLPVIMHYSPYSRSWGFGNLSIHGHLKYSWWTYGQYNYPQNPEIIGEHYYEFTSPYFLRFIMAYKCPSSCLDIGISVCLNPLKFVPLWLRLGIQRLDYGYHLPKSFKEARTPAPGSIETRFYLSYGISLGYWGIR